VLWGIMVAALLISIFALAWQKFQRPAVVDYDGQIVGRWATFSESETGSRAYYKLLVQKKTGERITVVVESETYARAQVGMWIRSSSKGIELKPGQPSKTSGEP